MVTTTALAALGIDGSSSRRKGGKGGGGKGKDRSSKSASQPSTPPLSTFSPTAGDSQFPSAAPSEPVFLREGNLLVGESPDLTVIRCNSDDGRILVNGTTSGYANLVPGNLLFALPPEDVDICEESCALLARFILSTSIAEATGDFACPFSSDSECLMLETRPANLNEMISDALIEDFDISVAIGTTIESVIQSSCANRESRELTVVDHQSKHREAGANEGASDGDSILGERRHLQFGFPDDCGDWQSLILGRLCRYTRCEVGQGGDPFNCFSCGRTCDNTCGPVPDTPKNVLVNGVIIEIFPGVFDFSETCCIHDHCYSSIFSKAVCDLTFLAQNLLSCSPRDSDSLTVIGLPIPELGRNTPCEIAALFYFLGVAIGGEESYSKAQTVQRSHEASPVCNQKRPTAPPGQPGSTSGVFGDPHISTFDRLRFSCQAAGEFIMVTSLESPNFMIQERFSAVVSTICTQASVSTGIAIQEENLPKIQLTLPKDLSAAESPNMDTVAGCPLQFFLDGDPTTLESGTGTEDIEISVAGSLVEISFPFTGVEIRARVRESSAFGCFFTIQVFLPSTYRSDETIIGLLGKPNGNARDDWVGIDGTTLQAPANQEDTLFSAAYNYCVDNWCIKTESQSIFAHIDPTSFDSVNKCDEDFADDLEDAVANASDAVKNLCGGDLFCVVDGVCGNLEDASAALLDQSELETAQEDRDPLPSVAPSTRPSASFVPTVVPSSRAPSEVPSDRPSSTPSKSLTPSVPPSTQPSTIPSPMPTQEEPSSHPSGGKGGKGGGRSKGDDEKFDNFWE